MVRRLGVAASICLLCVVASDMACAAIRRRIALVHPDAEVLRSVVISLSAWDIDVLSAEVSLPGRSLPEAERYAAHIAVRFQADAVSWVSDAEGGSVLWIYDATTNDVASRVLRDRPPFDEPMAAAVALSLKALLRSSTVAPAAERFGAVSVIAAPASPSEFRLEGEAGARLAPAQLAELRATLGIALWPRALAERLGFALAASVGSGASVETPAVSATLTDIGLSSSLRTRIRVTPRFGLEPALGGTIHVMALEGEALPTQTQVGANRLDGSLDFALAADALFGSIAVGVRVTIGYLPRYQQYLVEGQSVLSLLPVFLDSTLRISAGIL